MVKPKKDFFRGKSIVFTDWYWQILPSLGIIGLVILAKALGLFVGAELQLLDRSLRLRPAENQDKRILIIGIDESDIQETGTYPIPGQVLSNLVKKLDKHDPQAIGIDIFRDLPVEPGHQTFIQTINTTPNVFVIEKIWGDPVHPPKNVAPDRVGIVDLPLDEDGFVRRAYLGSKPLATHPDPDTFRFSLALKLAEAFLAKKNQSLENGIRNPDNMRFGETELFSFHPNFGNYSNYHKAGGVQIPISPRSGTSPFKTVSMTDVLEGRVNPNVIRNRIILIGIKSLSAKDLINSAAIQAKNPGLVFGVEMHAHITSQILSAVLDDRPLLNDLGEGWEYLWLLIWGSAGAVVIYLRLSIFKYFFVVLIGYGLLLGSVFGFLWQMGLWLPILAPILLWSHTLLFLLQYLGTLQARAKERQQVIVQTYDAIHNGPLQTLAVLLRKSEHFELSMREGLENLDQELRAIYNRLLKESLPQGDQLQLSTDTIIDLRNPLHEVLYEVYTKTLRRDFPGFQSIQFQVVTFDAIDVKRLSKEDKQSICRFLEEALCNVGKHAVEANRLTVICQMMDTDNLIRVEDNGQIKQNLTAPVSTSRGSQQAHALAKKLGGSFHRSFTRKGSYCELRWPPKLSNGWWFR